jgi:TonB-linked SusC/RagA family outer membrane protein
MWIRAQNVAITGQITDAATKEALIGVSVVVKGKPTQGTVSNVDGRYSLNVPSGSTLIYSFIGYKTHEETLSDRTAIDISLVEDTEMLDEIVVIGYGTVRKSDLTGSVSSVKAEALTSIPATNIMQAMVGRAPGVYVRQNNGEPGGTISVRIRGTNSIQGSNEPLYVVDGFLYNGNPVMLNPNDIESMEILKDASATAIYGSRGANGVVLITTKQGKSGQTNIEIESSYSMQRVIKKLDMMNASEYASFMNQRLINDGGEAYFSNPESLGKGTNWQDEILHDAPLSNTSATISGGAEKTRFSISAGYYAQDGIVRKSEYNRLSLRSNIDHEINKYMSIQTSLLYSKIDRVLKNSGGSDRGTSMFSGMLAAPPTSKPYDENGELIVLNRLYPFISSTMRNPLIYINEENNKSVSDKLLLNAALTVKPVDGLSIKLSGGIDYNNYRSDNYRTSNFYHLTSAASIGTERIQSVLSENIISYSKKINDIHDLSVMTGFTYQDYKAVSASASGSVFISDAPETYALEAAANFGTPSSGYTDWAMLSYLSRVNYNLMNKYLLTASFRADGSSRYSKGNKWGFFPSVALAWRISEENFLKDNNLISDLKLRVGYGETGSTAISPYYTLNMLNSGKVVLNDELVTYYAPGTRLPGSLKWETTAQTNIGVDLGFYNNRYRLVIDYYIKNTRDLLNTVQLPASLGYTTTIQNVGEIRNKGLEIALDATIFDKYFYWNISPNISLNKNKVISLNEGEDIRGASYYNGIITDFINIIREGEPLGIFYGYKELGYDDTGKIVYEDIDGGGLSYNDKIKTGNPHPDFIYSINSDLAYKNFEMNLFIQGSYGNDIYNFSSMAHTQDMGYGLNTIRGMLNNTWTPENPNAKYPRLSRTNSARISDRFVEDGSYLRLKNIQLAYNIPLDKWGINWMQHAQIYISGQNLLTLTKYSWFDPEINYAGGSNSMNLGIDYYSYPVAKSVTLGIKLDF